MAAPRAKQRLKVVVRNLPPQLTEGDFTAAIDRACQGSAGWVRFTPGKVRWGQLSASSESLVSVWLLQASCVVT